MELSDTPLGNILLMLMFHLVFELFNPTILPNAIISQFRKKIKQWEWKQAMPLRFWPSLLILPLTIFWMREIASIN